jgi:hypothetical protein
VAHDLSIAVELGERRSVAGLPAPQVQPLRRELGHTMNCGLTRSNPLLSCS